ncbi:MAG TPA: peptide ABC transporter substrate-binding protein, partial [Pirellulales bacterium]|nr:peptide ABC transporter substrate-binding protein [Pirellulales bacterium]
MSARNLFPLFVLALLIAAMGWALSFGTLPPADFTFSNETEIKSVDPAVVTGVPDSRIVMSLFEGLVRWDPKTLDPIPGVAERWELSADKRVYTFHLRHDAKWSDGSPLTARDFYYSYRRLLDPKTASEYVYQLSRYLKGAQRYNSAEVTVGEPVEVEFKNADQAKPGARGAVLKGELVASVDVPDPHDDTKTVPVRTVKIDGHERKYCAEDVPETERVEQILPDFDSVGIKVLDDYTLELTINDPTPYFLSLTGFQTLSPVNQKCIETHGYPAWTKAENLVCNGSYKLTFRHLRDRIRLEKNPYYWNRDAVQLNIVDALSLSADTTALNLYLTRKVDWITTVPSTAIPIILREKRPDFHPAVELTTNFYRFNVTRPPLTDPRVRRALSMGLNRQNIIDTVTQMNEMPAYSLVPPLLKG